MQLASVITNDSRVSLKGWVLGANDYHFEINSQREVGRNLLT